MRVPLLDLKRQHAPLRAAIDGAIARVIDSGQFILGPEVEAFEREAAATLGMQHAVGVSSGTDALLVALMALGIGPGDEVVTSAFSFFATAAAIARLGARPVFADIGADFNIDPDAALARVTPRTRAILPVDLFGRPAALARLREAGIPIVEDAAQGAGIFGLGDPSGRSGGATMVALSFFPSKNLGALGDAGLVLTDAELLADRVRLLRAHGARPKYHHLVLGGNFRLDALQAAVLRVKLPLLSTWNETRRKNARHHGEALAGISGLILPAPTDGHIWHHYVVRVEGGRREALRAHLKADEVETEVYYPEALHLAPCFLRFGGQPGDFPQAEAAARESLAIPVHPDLDEAQLEHVVSSVRRFFAA